MTRAVALPLEMLYKQTVPSPANFKNRVRMNEGIYHVNFSAGGTNVGEGLVVIKGGAVNGGDPAYLYSGTMSNSGSSVSAQLHVQQWNTRLPSVFGPIKQFDLTLTGTASDANFSIAGHITGQPNQKINIAGKRLAAAV